MRYCQHQVLLAFLILFFACHNWHSTPSRWQITMAPDSCGSSNTIRGTSSCRRVQILLVKLHRLVVANLLSCRPQGLPLLSLLFKSLLSIIFLLVFSRCLKFRYGVFPLGSSCRSRAPRQLWFLHGHRSDFWLRRVKQTLPHYAKTIILTLS